MNVVRRWSLAVALLATHFHSDAESRVSECLLPEVEAHVRQQFAHYGPQSAGHEYFGFIYRYEGVIASAVTRSRACARSGNCVVDSNDAIRSIPRSATVLGEWHTHPHGGSPSLSRDDVLGAYGNRHISCYLAFYSTPSGDIYAWNPDRISVPVAMASRARVGNYFRTAVVQTAVVLAVQTRALSAAMNPPGVKGLVSTGAATVREAFP